MSTITKPIILDETGKAIVDAIRSLNTDGGDAVHYTAELKTEAEKAQARQNIGASDFSGNYNDLQEKPFIPTRTSELSNDQRFITIDDVPSIAADTMPLMDGTASRGSDDHYARADHVHPADTNKVDKVDGKDLSTNDYTDEDKDKLALIEDKAEVNKIDTVKVNGVAQAINDKSIDIEMPTKVSDLENDDKFVKEDDLETKGADSFVLHTETMSLSDDAKKIARDNIGIEDFVKEILTMDDDYIASFDAGNI